MTGKSSSSSMNVTSKCLFGFWLCYSMQKPAKQNEKISILKSTKLN